MYACMRALVPQTSLSVNVSCKLGLIKVKESMIILQLQETTSEMSVTHTWI